MKKTNYIFVTGGVMSSLGKGLCAASCASLLQNLGFSVRVRKMDPYLNVDPGTMSPEQHGEVFVTQDGAETDMDFGHYERFTGLNSKHGDNLTTGKAYSDLIARERKGFYLGRTVQVIPHLTDLIKEFIIADLGQMDFLICEIGGTVGDIEAQPFIEAIRQLACDLGSDRVCYIHLTFLPYISVTQELKTKPTQHSVKELNSMGIRPDIILCRSEQRASESDCNKISMSCNISKKHVIPAENVKDIYTLPINYAKSNLHVSILNKFGISTINEVDYSHLIKVLNKPITNGIVKISLICKYSSPDAYRSLIESLNHAALKKSVKLEINFVNSKSISLINLHDSLLDSNAILVPGGFGKLGIEGKILAIQYARTKNIPFFGICLGMQLAVIESARNVGGFGAANSTEFDSNCKKPLIGLLSEWMSADKMKKCFASSNMGGTMRLGSHQCLLVDNSKLHSIYNSLNIFERHRHRYEVNSSYLDLLKSTGLLCSGSSADGLLPEIFERNDHDWFIGVQFHPEFNSNPMSPHPLFASFVEAALKNRNSLKS